MPAERMINANPPGDYTVLTTTPGATTSGAGTITTGAAAPIGLQGGQFRALLCKLNSKNEVEEGEYVLVTGGQSGTTWTIERGPGVDGSTAISHVAGSLVIHCLTAGALHALLR